MNEEQKRMARRIAERWLQNPEILDKLLTALQNEEPEEWGDLAPNESSSPEEGDNPSPDQ